MHDGRTRKVEAPTEARRDAFLERYRASLTLVTGPEAGSEWVLEGRRQIAGRSEKATIQLDDRSVSSEHAAFELASDGFAVRDLASTNGVRVNGRDVLSQRLEHGDRVTLGDCELHYVVEARAARAPVWSVDDDA
jgi:S-DNA-T family DNA segregation ATPase FtsK/SpoIIIE